MAMNCFYGLRSLCLTFLGLIMVLGPSSSIASDQSFREAIKAGHIPIIKNKIEDGISPGQPLGPGGNTPLIVAALNGDTTLVKFLLNRDVALDAFNDTGFNALMAAVASGHSGVANQLLRSGADPNVRSPKEESSFYRTAPLLLAVDLGNLRIAADLLEFGARVDIRSRLGQTPLYLASCDDQTKAVSFLVARGATVNARDQFGWTPLACAVKNGGYESTRLLLASGANPNIVTGRGYTPLVIFSRALLRGSSSFNRRATSYRDEAEGSAERAEDIVRSLFLYGALAKVQDENGNSALHYMIRTERAGIVELLLHYNANPFLENDSGVSAIRMALNRNKWSLLSVLLKKNLVRSYTNPPIYIQSKLIKAVSRKQLNEVSNLIQRGGNPNHESLRGWTPLLRAVDRKQEILVRYLLKKGANPCRRNKWNVNAYEIDSLGIVPGNSSWCTLLKPLTISEIGYSGTEFLLEPVSYRKLGSVITRELSWSKYLYQFVPDLF